jgi:hypothetical protein
MNKRKEMEKGMTIKWPSDINALIIKKQLEIEAKTKSRVKKTDAVIALIRDLKKKKETV